MGFKYGVFASTFSVRAVFNWVLKRIGWSEPQVDTDMHLKQCCRHLSSVDMVLHAFFGDCGWHVTARIDLQNCWTSAEDG